MFGNDRLLLRGATPRDLELLVTMANDVESVTMASPVPPTPVAEATISERLAKGHPAPFTAAARAVELVIAQPSDAGIGVAGLYQMDRANGTVEIGVSLAGGHRGEGLGQTAHELLITYAFQGLGFRRVYGHAKASNERVIALCTRIGMTHEGTLRAHRWRLGTHEDLLVFGLLHDEWPPVPS